MIWSAEVTESGLYSVDIVLSVIKCRYSQGVEGVAIASGEAVSVSLRIAEFATAKAICALEGKIFVKSSDLVFV